MRIRVLDFNFRKHPEGFQLDVRPRDAPLSLTTVNFDLPPSSLLGFELKRLDFDAKDPAGRVERLREFGRRLYQQIFTGEVARIWSEQKQHDEFLVLCIRVAPDAGELEAIAWETLFDGEEFITAGARTTISRLPLDLQPQSTLPAVSLPVKMLAFVSSPLDLSDNSRLEMEREQELLLEAINNPAGQGRISLEFEDEARLERLESSLKTAYQIFHFTGHGIAPENGGGLLLEDAQGNSRPTSVAEILHAFRHAEDSLRLIVLSGCQTARIINPGEFSDMARGLLRRHVPAVIAMQFSISDLGGLRFAESFYADVAAGQRMELAVHAARRNLLLSEDYYLQADALAAVLLTSNGDCLATERAEATASEETPKIDVSFYLPLPQLNYSFYGRRREYRLIRDGMLQLRQRAVIIQGIGGIGKTALVSHVATRLQEHFRGVYAFDCSSGTLTPETILAKLNRYFAAQDVHDLERLVFKPAPPEVLATHLAQLLSQWPLLLIFDNFESHLQRTKSNFRIADENLRSFVATLINTTAANSHFLFTSRQVFEFGAKRSIKTQTLQLRDLSRPEALSMMQKLTSLAETSYAEKCEALKLLGGHPYALVTLDLYCQHQSLREALDAAAGLITELREFLTIDLSHAQLSERGRELLHCLAAFRESVPAEAADWVMGEDVSYAADFLEQHRERLSEEAGELNDDELLQMLEASLPRRRQTEDLTAAIKELTEWGLLLVSQEDDGQTELTVHNLVRDFCRQKQPVDIWRARLLEAAAFYTNQTIALQTSDKTPADILVEMEAFELLMEAEAFDDAARLLLNTSAFLERWGLGNYFERQYRRVLEKLAPANTAAVLHNLGILVQERGDYKEALAYYQRALKIQEESGNDSGATSALLQIGRIHEKCGEYREALECFQRTLESFAELKDESGVAHSLHNMGTVQYLLGDADQALEYFKRALTILERLGKSDDIVSSLHQIGVIHQEHGEYDEALAYYHRSIAMSEKLGKLSLVAYSLHQIGLIHQKQGDYEKALDFYERSLEIKEELDDRFGVASSFHQIGRIYQEEDDYPGALDYYQRSLEIFEEIGDVFGAANSLHNMGVIHQLLHAYEAAQDCYRRSAPMFEKIGDRLNHAGSLYQSGTLFIETEEYLNAFALLASALTIFVELRAPATRAAVEALKVVRAKWGAIRFDAMWSASFGEEVSSVFLE